MIIFVVNKRLISVGKELNNISTNYILRIQMLLVLPLILTPVLIYLLFVDIHTLTMSISQITIIFCRMWISRHGVMVSGGISPELIEMLSVNRILRRKCENGIISGN